MGQVFRAEHLRMGRTVAVKVLPKNKSTPEAIASFTREIRAQAALDHENLVGALDAGHDGNVYFLVCEYVPGANLRQYIRDRGPLGMAEAATIISQAARGLDHAHRQGLIHRDVKPANLLVTPEGHTKVSDLGLVGSLNQADNDPRAGKIVGTADYLSPEQIISPRAITTTSDIYSLGCTLYYAVTGKVPFPGGNARDKAHRHCESTPLHPRLLNPSLSVPFVEVIADMMEKDPAKRVSTAAAVVERLRPWAGESVSSPRDPQDARRTREGDFDVDSGAGELVDTSVSFEFDLALPPRKKQQTNEPPPQPVPALPWEAVFPNLPLPPHLATGLPARSPSSERHSWKTPLIVAAAVAAAVSSVVAILLQLVLGGI
jgi:serine/threonine protein kinase